MWKYVTVASMLCASLAADRPAIAQSNSGFELARTSFTSVREYVAAEAIPMQLSELANVVIADMYRPRLNTMLRHSPTFRRQCQRIAAESWLTVHVEIGTLDLMSSARAVTRVTRLPSGRMLAHIVIGERNDFVELIAHEFEHVIEQLDGIDLPALATRPRSGVHEESGMRGRFETVRARQAGRKVFAELWRSL